LSHGQIISERGQDGKQGETTMELTRRSFLAATGAVGTGALLGFLGLDLKPSVAYAQRARPQRGRIYTTICPYCGVGCGAVVEVNDAGKVVNIEGDADHPINEGSLCSKGASLFQIHANDRRLQKVKHRRPGAGDWEELSWDQAMKMIAERVKKTRDETWADVAGDLTVNRTDGIACLGGAALDTEECYLLVKAMRAMGLVWIEHQARI
jgi:formate dehydrogenase major subunit